MVFIFLVFWIVGKFDYDQSVHDEAVYCEMARLGFWPAYDKTIVCEVESDRK